jgi:hypothetical protein
MADSLREAFAVAGIEVTPEPEPEPSPERDEPGIEFETWAPDHRPLSWQQRFGIRNIGVSRHAAERYRERFGSDRDDLNVARDQLRGRLDNGSVTYCRERPRWLVIVPKAGGQYAENSAGVLIVDDEIALPIRKGTSRSQPYYIVTCIARI